MWKMVYSVYAFLLGLSLSDAVRIKVKECPVTETAWQARSQLFECKSPLVYHCIQDNVGKLMETCMRAYPIKPLFEDGCPWALHFVDGDSLLGSIFYPCNKTGCPQKNDPQYWTNQLYKYPICLHYNQTSEIINSTTPIPLECTIVCDDRNEIVINAIVTTAVVLVILLIVTVLAWKYRRRLNFHAFGVEEKLDSTLQHALIPAAAHACGVDEEKDSTLQHALIPAAAHACGVDEEKDSTLQHALIPAAAQACGVDEESDNTPQHALIPAADSKDHKKSEDNFSTELHILCKKGDLIKVEHLIHTTRKGFNIKDDNGKSLLHSAGLSKSIKLVEYLINNGCDLYSKDDIGQTIAHIACQEGDVNLVKYLIDKDKGLLNMKDRNGVTPFHCAGFSGSLELVKYLINYCRDMYRKSKSRKSFAHNVSNKEHANLVKHLIDEDRGVLNIKDNSGSTPFHCAGFSGSVELVQYLIDNGCDVYSKNFDGRTIVHIACQKGHFNLVKHLTNVDKGVLNIEDNDGMTPFHCAGFSGSVELVQYLIDNGCDVYSKDNDGWTIAHYACQEGHVSLVKHLTNVDKGVLNIEDNIALTPFHCAGFSGSLELVQYLIDNGCDVYSKDNNGWTIVHYACQKGHVNLVKYLKDVDKSLLNINDNKGTNVDKGVLNIEDNDGMTPFHCAGFSGSVELVQYLIDNGCDVYSKDNSGCTIVHNACQRGHINLVRIILVNLVKYLVDKDECILNLKNKNGLTPFLYAGFSGSVELVQYLIDNGCDVYSKDNDGWTIVHIACWEGYVNLVKHLTNKDKGLLNIKDNIGITPVAYAKSSGSSDLVDYLRNVVCE